MNILRRITQTNDTALFNLDHVLANYITSHILELNSICSDRMGLLHSRIHPLKYVEQMCLFFNVRYINTNVHMSCFEV